MKKESDFIILKKLFSLFAKRNKSTIVSGILLSLVAGTRPYISIILSGILIDGLVDKKELIVLLQYTAIGLSVILGMQLIEAYLREFFNARVENCLERQNLDMNEKSMDMIYKYLESSELQEKKRKQEQVVNVRGGIYSMIIWPLDRGLSGLISVITAAVVAVPLFQTSMRATGYGILSSNWLTVALFVLLALCAYSSFWVSDTWNKKTRNTFEKYAECKKVSNYFMHNILSRTETMKDLRIFHQEKLVEEGITNREEEANGIMKQLRRLWMQESCIENTVSNVSAGLVYLYAALKAYMGLISIGSVVLYAGSIIRCVDGLIETLFSLSLWRQAVDYGRDYLEYIEFTEEREKGELPIDIHGDGHFDVEFVNVSFKYPGSDIYVIRNLNLKLNLGEKLAVVGKNGSGKTTFIKLLCRLYDVTEGEIRLNGNNISDYDLEEYMKLFSVVFQDFRIFDLKLGENIAAGEKVDIKRAEDALMKAGLKERYVQLPDGLDTFVGKEFDEKGINFSGGERQKIAIARAIYKGAPFVIMDEPTAALDPISECDVYAGFDEMVGKKAAIYISHRLASCRFCNDIIVFDGGRVLQHGSHDKLVKEDGLYQKLWTAQAQYYEV